MLRYAIKNGEKCKPFKGGRETCPTCGGNVLAKCGRIKVHHWAHESRIEDCDPWSEHVGPWHLSWQEKILDQFVEVTIGLHRADVIGNHGIVVELQHSNISSDEILEREKFYGDMIWLFDSTERFRFVSTGDRVFFSLGRNKHIETCQKPVYLDRGDYVVEVETFTRTFDKFSGIGRLRTHGWFADNFLSKNTVPNARFSNTSRNLGYADSWPGKQPWRLTPYPSKWNVPGSDQQLVVPKGRVYLPLNYSWRGHDGPVWLDIIREFPDVANGWKRESVQEMQELLTATPMILEGQLRLLPAPSDQMRRDFSPVFAMKWLSQVDGHIAAGRLPLIKKSTTDLLIVEQSASNVSTRRKSSDDQKTFF